MAKPRPIVPADQFGEPLHSIELQATALTRSVHTSLATSQKIDINSNARLIKVYAITKDVYLKWASSATDYCKADNFDEVIIAGTQKKFFVPMKADGSFYSIFHLLERAASANAVVIQY